MTEEYDNFDDDYDWDTEQGWNEYDTEDRAQEFIFFGIVSGFFNWLFGG